MEITGESGRVYRLGEEIADTGRSLLRRVYNGEGGKVAKSHMQGNEVTEKRFGQEVRLLKNLNHRHIIKVQDVGRYEGHPFYVMDAADTDLEQLSSDDASETERLHAILGVARALVYLHEVGVVHRDVKPDNILIHNRVAKLCDFGHAKVVGDTEELLGKEGEEYVGLTRSWQAVGTPAYMSPEQCKDSRAVGPQTDMYSLTLSMYMALSGEHPLYDQRGAEPRLHELWQLILNEAPEPISRFRPDLPSSVRELIESGLGREPDSRPTAQQFATKLEAILSSPRYRISDSGPVLEE